MRTISGMTWNKLWTRWILTESGKFTPKLPYNLWFASGRAFAFRGCYAPGEQTAEKADASTSSAVYKTVGHILKWNRLDGFIQFSVPVTLSGSFP